LTLTGLRREGDVVREQVEARLAELQRELELGERQLRDLELQQIQLRETVLRISGAVQVLRELLAAGESPVSNGIEGQSVGSASAPERSSSPAPATPAGPLGSS
jgi:hypothetical protein